MYAWTKCSSDQYFMTFTAFKCAIGYIGPHTYIHREVLENIYINGHDEKDFFKTIYKIISLNVKLYK